MSTQSPFMIPQYQPGFWYEVETSNGSVAIPADLVGNDPSPEDFSDFCEGDYESHEKVEGIGARLSAPGYMDCTDWSVFETLEAAKQHIEDTFEVDPETGASFED